MIDFGFDKLLLIGAVSLIVIGPEKLPRVARTIGHLVGKAQRYMADVKAGVNRSIELEELRKMKTEIEDTAKDVQRTIHQEIDQARHDLGTAWDGTSSSLYDHALGYPAATSSPYKPPRKNWRLKRSAMPLWYKQRAGVRRHTQSGAARVARFRPPRNFR